MSTIWSQVLDAEADYRRERIVEASRGEVLPLPLGEIVRRVARRLATAVAADRRMSTATASERRMSLPGSEAWPAIR